MAVLIFCFAAGNLLPFFSAASVFQPGLIFFHHGKSL